MSWGIEAWSILGKGREGSINHEVESQKKTTVLCPGGNPGTWPVRIVEWALIVLR